MVNIYLPRSINLDVHLNRSQYLLSVYLFLLLLILLKAFIYSYKAAGLVRGQLGEEQPLFIHCGQSLCFSAMAHVGHRGHKLRAASLQRGRTLPAFTRPMTWGQLSIFGSAGFSDGADSFAWLLTRPRVPTSWAWSWLNTGAGGRRITACPQTFMERQASPRGCHPRFAAWSVSFVGSLPMRFS